MNHWKKRFLALSLSLCMSTALSPAAFAAEQEEPDRGTLTYAEAIAPQYEKAGVFSDGLAPVKQNGKWGYINTDNEVVIPFQYDAAGIFNEGYAVVGTLVSSQPEVEYDWETGEAHETGRTTYTFAVGFVDADGNYKPFKDPYHGEYSGLEEITTYTTDDLLTNDIVFYNGYITFNGYDGPDGYLYDTNGDIVELENDAVGYRYSFGWQVTENTVIVGEGAVLGGEQCFYQLDSGRVIELPELSANSYYDLRPFNQGIAPVAVVSWDETAEVDSARWGFIDKTGKFVIQPQYAGFTVSDIYGAYQVFGDTGVAMTQNANGKYGGVNKSGTTVIPFQYDKLYNYDFGLALFEKNGKWGYLDENGATAIAAQYEQATSFGPGGYAVAYDGSKAFLIDSKGNTIVGSDKLDADTYFQGDESDDSRVLYSPDEYVVINENGKYGYGHISYLPPLPEKSEMSSWAYEEVTAAIEENLVPTYLQNLYFNNINRNEFCDLTMQAVSETMDKEVEDIVRQETGKELTEWTQQYPFYDTTNSDIIAAYALGIVNGRGGGQFDPYASITREEAAAFLMRSAKVLGMDTTQISDAQFADAAEISASFRDAVNFVYQIKVMNGTGGGKFTPDDNYTREQSFVTIYRLFQAVLAE